MADTSVISGPPGISAVLPAIVARPLLAGGLASASMATVCMLWIDRPLALYFKHQAHPAIVAAFGAVTDMGRGEWYFAIAAAALICGLLFARHGVDREARIYGLYLAARGSYLLTALATAGLAAVTLKLLFGRMRPRYLFEGDLYGLVPGNLDFAMNSFPSGHAQVIWTVVAVLCILAPACRRILIPVAVVVAFSRVAVTAHFASDVIAGAYVGLASAILLRRHVFPDVPDMAHRDLTPRSGINRRWRRAFLRSQGRPAHGMPAAVAKPGA